MLLIDLLGEEGAMSLMWKSEDSSVESVLSFHCVSSGTHSQAVSPGGKQLYLLTSLAGPYESVLHDMEKFPDSSLFVQLAENAEHTT